MIQRNFEKALKKGAIGEDIVQGLLERKGFVVYKPVTNGSHAFDILAIKNKEFEIAMDVKAKARMNKYHATGVDQNHFSIYKKFSEKHNMSFHIWFVDEMEKQIYGNSIEELEKPRTHEGREYPFIMKTRTGNIRLWSLKSMLTIATLSEEQCNQLKKYNQRNYNFKQV